MRITGNRLDFAQIDADMTIMNIPRAINWKRIIIIIHSLILPTWFCIEYILRFFNIPRTSTDNIIVILMILNTFSFTLLNIYTLLN